jgi:tRNA pseudouridine55 synthase
MTLQSPKSESIVDGVLPVDKEEGESSFGAVRRVRRILGIKKAGHAGTLDPFATGLLVVLLGQGTKLSPFLMPGRKRYLATLRLGIETDTLDFTGQVVRTRPVPVLGPEEVREKTRLFLGDVEQVPPSFSAVKHEGRRAYDLARQGLFFALKKRIVTIHRLDVLSVDLPDVTLTVECTGGTYIRSLAADLGEALGAGAHLRALRRLASGALSVDEAVSLGHLPGENAGEVLKSKILSLKDSLPEVREHPVDVEGARRIRNGYQPRLDDLAAHGTLCAGRLKLVIGPELVAVAEVTESGERGGKKLRILRVFH